MYGKQEKINNKTIMRNYNKTKQTINEKGEGKQTIAT